MKNHFHWFRTTWVLIAAICGSGTAWAQDGGSASITRRVGRLDFVPCSLSGGVLGHAVDAQCTTLSVAESREAPDGRRIELAIALIPAKREAVPDPVFMLAGGPGQSARDSYTHLTGAFAEVGKTHNVVLVDQRGTGKSNRLTCVGRADAGIETTEPDLDDVRRETRRCVEKLGAQADLTRYSTTDAIADLDEVREALGLTTINLVGISYGTRVAQQYAKRYPANTRTVTLDGVVPNTLVLGNEHAKNLEASLNAQLAQCTHDPRCADKLGDPRARLDALFTVLKTASPLVHFRSAMTGQMQHERLTRRHVAMVMRLYSYMPMLAGLLPLVLKEAGDGRYEPLMAMAELVGQSFQEGYSTGMQYSVMCTEDANELTVDPADAQTVLGNDLVFEAKAACEVWPHGTRPADFRAPLTGALPVLLLSGELDPVTPPRYGEEVARHLPNARHLIIKGQGHNVLPVGCVPKLLSQFIRTADAKQLDEACLKKVPKALPFVDFYGWEP